MNSNPRKREEFLAGTEVGRVMLLGAEHEFRFPGNPFMREVVAGIFRGDEYPIILPGYVPEKIVDIGANVGAATLFFHNVYPSAKIWSYEPCQESFWCLEANTRGFAAQIQVFPYGLLDRDCELPMYHGSSQCGQNSLIPSIETKSTAGETVRLVKAAREAAERGWQHLSIVKMDTEGCERPIVAELLAAVPQIDVVYCEYHAEDDRRSIDSLMADRFVLGTSKADKPHQGMCVYVSRVLLQRYPMFERLQKQFPRSMV
jgi:FkbM family methyltransferase